MRCTTCNACDKKLFGHKRGLCISTTNGILKATVYQHHNYHGAKACKVWPLESKYGVRCITFHACVNRLFGHKSGLWFCSTNGIVRATVHQAYNYLKSKCIRCLTFRKRVWSKVHHLPYLCEQTVWAQKWFVLLYHEWHNESNCPASFQLSWSKCVQSLTFRKTVFSEVHYLQCLCQQTVWAQKRVVHFYNKWHSESNRVARS